MRVLFIFMNCSNWADLFAIDKINCKKKKTGKSLWKLNKNNAILKFCEIHIISYRKNTLVVISVQLLF